MWISYFFPKKLTFHWYFTSIFHYIANDKELNLTIIITEHLIFNAIIIILFTGTSSYALGIIEQSLPLYVIISNPTSPSSQTPGTGDWTRQIRNLARAINTTFTFSRFALIFTDTIYTAFTLARITTVTVATFLAFRAAIAVVNPAFVIAAFRL